MSGDDLESVVDKRLVELLHLATDPKDLTAALKVAIDRLEQKKGTSGGWGTKLSGGQG